jgi:hypothetical protein
LQQKENEIKIQKNPSKSENKGSVVSIISQYISKNEIHLDENNEGKNKLKSIDTDSILDDF